MGEHIGRWEYKRLSLRQLAGLDPNADRSLAAGLNVLGARGWELIDMNDGATFKRYVQAEHEPDG
jgi:hypothetical protein